MPKGKIQSKTPCPNVNSIGSVRADDSNNAITNMDYKRECKSDYDSLMTLWLQASQVLPSKFEIQHFKLETPTWAFYGILEVSVEFQKNHWLQKASITHLSCDG